MWQFSRQFMKFRVLFKFVPLKPQTPRWGGVNKMYNELVPGLENAFFSLILSFQHTENFTSELLS